MIDALDKNTLEQEGWLFQPTQASGGDKPRLLLPLVDVTYQTDVRYLRFGYDGLSSSDIQTTPMKLWLYRFVAVRPRKHRRALKRGWVHPVHGMRLVPEGTSRISPIYPEPVDKMLSELHPTFDTTLKIVKCSVEDSASQLTDFSTMWLCGASFYRVDDSICARFGQNFRRRYTTPTDRPVAVAKITLGWYGAALVNAETKERLTDILPFKVNYNFKDFVIRHASLSY